MLAADERTRYRRIAENAVDLPGALPASAEADQQNIWANFNGGNVGGSSSFDSSE